MKIKFSGPPGLPTNEEIQQIPTILKKLWNERTFEEVQLLRWTCNSWESAMKYCVSCEQADKYMKKVKM